MAGSWKKTILEFANRPREAHSVGYGAMPTYLGISHGLNVPMTGVGLEQLSLGIAVGLLVFGNKSSMKWMSKKLPGDIRLPDDITLEKHYFWIGLTLVYLSKDLIHVFPGVI